MSHTQPPPGFGPPPSAPKKSRTGLYAFLTACVAAAAIGGTAGALSADDGQADRAAPAAAETSTLPATERSLSPECRAWIKSELLDSTETIDAAPGYAACGDLSDEELQAAIDEVAGDLLAEMTPAP